MRFALVAVAVNIVLGVILFKLIGVPGIAAATAVAAWINVGQMGWALWGRNVYRPSPATFARLLRIFTAVAVLAAMLWTADHFRSFLEAPFGEHKVLKILGGKEITVLAVTALAALAYPVLVVITGSVTVAEMRSMLRRPPKAAPAPPRPDRRSTSDSLGVTLRRCIARHAHDERHPRPDLCRP